jgi:hypothetical protein
MKITYGGEVLEPKPHLQEQWQELVAEYRQDTMKILNEAFSITESDWRESHTMITLLDRKRDEAAVKLDEINRAYEPRFRALAI